MKKYLGEALWTFFFVLSIGLAVKFGGGMTALAIGLALAVLVYAGGHISGAHFNPAVTLWLATSGKLWWGEVIPYWVSQIVWWIIGGMVAMWIIGWSLTTVTVDASALKVILVELLYTFALVWVVHNTAATKANEGNNFYGFAIWLTVFVWAVTVGSISWWAFNPAVVIGSWFDGLFAWSFVWQHLVGQLLGWVLAWLTYKSLN